jgi:RHS repeat-associated protein
MLKMPQLQLMQWDFRDCLEVTQRQAVNAEDADGTLHQGEHTYYVYNSSGQRTRKITERQNGTLMKERFYQAGYEVYREYDPSGNTVTLERQSLHVMDDRQRIALVETQTKGGSNPAPQLFRYQFSNHLGSASLELDELAQLISYEEYFPYGSTSYQAGRSAAEVSLKRYRYTGMERDEESGLGYHGARYYASWLGRWSSCDPASLEGGINSYLASGANPVVLVDPTGRAPTKYEKQRARDTAAKQREMVDNLYKARNQGYKTDPMQDRANRRAKKAGKTPIEHHHHKGVKESAKTKLPLEEMGDPMTSVWSTKRDPKVWGNVGEDARTHHNIAKHLDYAEQAKAPRTAADLKAAADTAKWRYPATGDLTERAKHDWTRTEPVGPAVDPTTGSVKFQLRKEVVSPNSLGKSVQGALEKVEPLANAGVIGDMVKDTYEGHPGRAAVTGAISFGVTKLLGRFPALVPLAIMAATISAYDDKVSADANAAGEYVDPGDHTWVGGVAAAGTATGESIFNATFKPIGKGIGEGLAALYLWLSEEGEPSPYGCGAGSHADVLIPCP